MPKANETKNTKVAAKAETKVETKAAEVKTVETKAAEATQMKLDEVKIAPAKKPAEKKTAAKKVEKVEKKENIFLQVAGQEYDMSEIMNKVTEATKSLRSVQEINIYVKPEEKRAYYVAKKAKGEEVGSVEI